LIQKLKDIPRLLSFVRLYSGGGKNAQDYFLTEFNRSGILEGEKHNSNSVLEFCLATNLLKKNEEKIVVTDIGNKILQEFEGNYDLNETQKEIIAKECLLKGEYSEKIIPMFQFFKRNYSRKTLYCSKILVGQVGDLEILPLLYQSDILRREGEIVVVNPKYVYLISLSQYLDPKKQKLTREQRDQIQETKDEIGEIGEEIVMEFERNRLIELGFEPEATNVLQVSLFNDELGYDIGSYNLEGDSLMKHDRLIEVKSSIKNKFKIYLSSNETNVAKIEGERYWIYFVGGIDIDTRKSSQELVKIQNPYQNILNNSNYITKEIVSYYITRNLNSKE